MKRFIKVIVAIFMLFVIISGGFLFYLSRGLEEGKNLVINNVELSSLADGIYKGKYNGGRWSNEVQIEIKNNKINKIRLNNDVLFPRDEVSDELFTRVINKQAINVNIVSGASVTSKAYLKSIELALKDGR